MPHAPVGAKNGKIKNIHETKGNKGSPIPGSASSWTECVFEREGVILL
jgi:hypothetical protein